MLLLAAIFYFVRRVFKPRVKRPLHISVTAFVKPFSSQLSPCLNVLGNQDSWDVITLKID